MRVVSTVLIKAGSAALTTWSDVQLELGLKDADRAWTEKAITRVSAIIAQYCNRVFGLQVIQDEFIPENQPFGWQYPDTKEDLRLSAWPVQGAASVALPDRTLLDGVDYRLDPKSGELFRIDEVGQIIPWIPLTVTAVYEAGYILPNDSGYVAGDASALPADIQDAAISLVRARYFARKRDPLLKSEDVPDVGAAQYWIGSVGDKQMPSDIASTLDNYRPGVIA
ncbi:MAG TPA: hypothetical protein VM639_24735 [Dongiaceae bacterium]|nr:hypothetical protein [Dongiaceae bacterium]